MIVVGVACFVTLGCIVIALIKAVLPSKQKWEQLKRETEERRSK